MGDDTPKMCPWCAEALEPGAARCRSCGEVLDRPVVVNARPTDDLTDAFRWPFDDPEWVRKTLVGSACMLLAVPTLLITNLVLLGYDMRIMRQQRDHPGRRPMPEWDRVGDLLGDGARLFVTLLLPGLCIMAFFGVVFGSLVAADLATTGKPGPFMILGIIFCEFGIIGTSLGFSFFVPAIRMEHLETGSVGAAFHLRALWQRAFNADYLILFVVDFAAGMLGGMGALLCYVGLFFTIPLSLYVRSAIIGRYMATAQAREHGLTKSP